MCRLLVGPRYVFGVRQATHQQAARQLSRTTIECEMLCPAV